MHNGRLSSIVAPDLRHFGIPESGTYHVSYKAQICEVNERRLKDLSERNHITAKHCEMTPPYFHRRCHGGMEESLTRWIMDKGVVWAHRGSQFM
ncbi:hypothetical protein NPIL_463551 [Nephila pilipes]|uniref:Uncharacterized protein n=1 Tax=Nephila pilipes TaxID=299642 RepID=A0A8X6QTQ1_NEPPI|nr:hypothetical protein NPIL_463551 [Nephila pilipes]